MGVPAQGAPRWRSNSSVLLVFRRSCGERSSSSSSWVALALAAPQVPAAHAAQYGVTTCAGQAAGVGGWSGFTRGSHPAKLQETCATGGVMYAALQGNVATSAGDAGWQLVAPAATSIAGVTLVRKLVVAGTRYTYTARALTPVAANTQNFESCINPAGCKDEIARGSLTWTSPRADVNRLEVYVSCAPTADVACQKVAGAEAAAVRISRADITLNDTTVPTISSPPSSPMFATGEPVSGVQAIAVVLQGHRRWHRLDRHPGRRTDGERGPRPQLDLSHALSPARACPLSLSSTLQFNPAAVPDGPHQLRVFARDATGSNVGYSQDFAVTTSARGAVNGTNGSDQAKLTVGVRRAVKAGRRAPRTHSTITVPYNAKTVADGRLVNSAGQPVIGARLTVATAVDRGVPVYADLPANVVTDAKGHFKVTAPPRTVAARAGPLLRARARHHPSRTRRRPHEGRHARHLLRSPPPPVARGSARCSAVTSSAAPPAGHPRRAPRTARPQLRDTRLGRHRSRRHLPRRLPLHPRRARAIRVPPARAPLPSLPLLPGLLTRRQRLRALISRPPIHACCRTASLDRSPVRCGRNPYRRCAPPTTCLNNASPKSARGPARGRSGAPRARSSCAA